MRNLSINPLKSTDFKMVDSSKDKSTSNNKPTLNSTDSATTPPPPARDPVFFRNDGEGMTSGTDSHKFKSVILDENGQPKKNANGEVMYRVRPHPDTLPGKNFRIPHPDTGLPTHIVIEKLIDDYKKGLEKYAVCQAHFEIKYSKDNKEEVMSYNDIVEFVSRDASLYDGEYWYFRKIIGHQRAFPNDPHYKGSSYNTATNPVL